MIQIIRSHRLAVVVVLSLVCSMSSGQESDPPERAYRTIAEEFLASYLSSRPDEAVSLGLHQYDGKVANLHREALDSQHAALKTFRARLAKIPADKLDHRVDIQRRLLLTAIDKQL